MVQTEDFFPAKFDLRNHCNLAFAKRKLAKLDQENMNRLVEQWRESADSDDSVLFRSYVASTFESEEILIAVVSSDYDVIPIIYSKQTMLFMHRMSRQSVFSNAMDMTSICLLDATYKTWKYALPLFLFV